MKLLIVKNISGERYVKGILTEFGEVLEGDIYILRVSEQAYFDKRSHFRNRWRAIKGKVDMMKVFDLA